MFLMEVTDAAKLFEYAFFTTPFHNWSFKQIRDTCATAEEWHQLRLDINQQNTPVCVRMQRPSKRQMLKRKGVNIPVGMIQLIACAKGAPVAAQPRTGTAIINIASYGQMCGGRTILNAGSYNIFVKPGFATPYVMEVLCPSTAEFSLKAIRTTTTAYSSDESVLGSGKKAAKPTAAAKPAPAANVIAVNKNTAIVSNQREAVIDFDSDSDDSENEDPGFVGEDIGLEDEDEEYSSEYDEDDEDY